MKMLLPLLVSALYLTTTAAESGAGGATEGGGAGGAADAATTETITLSLTSKDSKAKLKIVKIVVEETKDGKTEEYVIDMTERKVFLGNKHEILNDLEVFQPGMDCTWTLPEKLEVEIEYKFDAFEVRI